MLKKIPHNFVPFAGRANAAYRAADALVAVSARLLDRAHEANPNAPGEVVYIGADFDTLERVQAKTFSDGLTHFFYLGTLSFSYDMEIRMQRRAKAFECRRKSGAAHHGWRPRFGKTQSLCQ